MSADAVVPLKVLGFGTFDERAHPRVGVLLDGFEQAGETVVRCNVPLGLDTAARVRLLQQPWRLPLLGIRLGRCWSELTVNARRALPDRDVVLVGYLGHFDVLLARALFPRTTIVLDHLIGAADTAADRGERGGLKQRLLRGLDRAATAAADVVVVDTDEHLAQLPAKARAKALVVEVGAPAWWTGPQPRPDGDPEADDEGGPLTVVFFGLFTPLQGAPAMAAAAGLLADDERVTFTFVGSGQDLAAAQLAAAANPHVTWTSWVESEELPALVAAHEVCLGIFGTTEKAGRVVPNKVFQGAAAGCAVVTSDTAPQRRVLGDAAVFVPAGDAVALAGVLAGLARDPERLLALRRTAWTRAQERFLPVAVTAGLRDLLHRQARAGGGPWPGPRVRRRASAR
jgi:glycosyltransferase involved in cell wall biosynthesis